MRIEVLSTKHYEYMFNKYKMLYSASSIVNTTLFIWNRVVLTMDEAEYIKEIQLAGKAKPVDMPSK